jgi:hypothetical protein
MKKATEPILFVIAILLCPLAIGVFFLWLVIGASAKLS